ncbi:hypothetical protein [Elizabethkingia miricola]|uniref:hypothetical protein n=1 Tax=Elizabethkingia miricola TaxID=172045 RepID=UPI00099A1CE6|nr:hypothetical protein [Elizabethkingia miricola]OPC34613.1 hypothetical protein BAX99_07020 [Elizabethkingia miricola]
MNNELQAVRQQNFTLNFFDRDQMEAIQQGAKMLAHSDLVPDIYKVTEKNPLAKAMANCIIALEMSQRIGASPLMIMQNMIVIYGKPSWSSTFLIATVNTCGRFEPLKYRFTNKGKLGKVDYTDYEWNGSKKVAVTKVFDGTKIDNIECVAWTKAKGTEDILESSPIDLKLAIQEGWYTKAGSKWQTMEKQMLTYRSAAFWIRAYAPEISMGMQTAEEVQDIQTYDADFVVVDQKVSEEIKHSANVEEIKMPEENKQDPGPDLNSEPTSKIPTASPEIAFPEDKNNNKPNF